MNENCLNCCDKWDVKKCKTCKHFEGESNYEPQANKSAELKTRRVKALQSGKEPRKKRKEAF